MRWFAAVPRAYVCEQLPQGRYLISAAQYWTGDRFASPRTIPDREWFIDSGAFSFQEGVPFSTDQYLAFAEQWKPTHVAAIDVFRNGPATVDRLWQDESKYLASGLPVVPVVTGVTIADYVSCARDVAVVYPWVDVYAVGGIKRRADVHLIVSAISLVIKRMHLFGASIPQLRKVAEFGLSGVVTSADTSSWNSRFGRDLGRFNLIMSATGKTQKQVAIETMLPEYRKHFEHDFNSTLPGFFEMINDIKELTR